MVLDLHTEGQRLLGHVAPDPPHAQDSQRLALRVAAHGRRRVPVPLAPPQGHDGDVEVPQGAQHEEDGRVGGGVVHCGGDVGDADAVFRAGMHVDRVVSRAVVADEPDAGGQRGDQLFVERPGDFG